MTSTEAGSPQWPVQRADQVDQSSQGLRDTQLDGTGSCGSSTTEGLSLITWADGTRTLIQYTTSGAAAAVALQGSVIDSTTLQPVDPLDVPLTVTTTRYAGYTPFGLLAFEATPSDCQTGVSAAGIEGVVGLGKQ